MVRAGSFWYGVMMLFCSYPIGLAQTTMILSGKVTDEINPLSEVVLRLQGTDITTTTDGDGNFELVIPNGFSPKSISAWKQGYYNGNIEIGKSNTQLDIVLIPLPKEDNPSYEWIDPAPSPHDKIYNCADCHQLIFQQWMRSGHAQSSTNQKFMDVYNGLDAMGNYNYQPGYRLDYPYSNGNCGNCHAPLAGVKNPIGINLNELKGVEKSGVSCDFCHKIKGIQLKENTSANTGLMQMDLLRPVDEHQVFFGPYQDSPIPYTFSPIISRSIYCAPCHEGGFWGVPIYESYSEWLKSPYAEKNIHCQDCHMPAVEATSKIDQGKTTLERSPSPVHYHLIKSPRDSLFLISAVEMITNGEIKGDILHLTVEIKNVGAGHHLPTGQPMRNMILVLEAVDSKGNNLDYIGENKIPFWGGHGNPMQGDFEGLPGKGFAKILFEHYSQYVQLKLGVKWQHIFPAPQWRVVRIKSDTRIPALTTDTSWYDFRISDSNMPVTVTCKLIYRDTFKNWADMKKWDLKDILLAEKVVHFR